MYRREHRFARPLNARTIRECMDHPLSSAWFGHTVGPITINAVYYDPHNSPITDEAKLICEAVLADVLGYRR